MATEVLMPFPWRQALAWRPGVGFLEVRTTALQRRSAWSPSRGEGAFCAVRMPSTCSLWLVIRRRSASRRAQVPHSDGLCALR